MNRICLCLSNYHHYHLLLLILLLLLLLLTVFWVIFSFPNRLDAPLCSRACPQLQRKQVSIKWLAFSLHALFLFSSSTYLHKLSSFTLLTNHTHTHTHIHTHIHTVSPVGKAVEAVVEAVKAPSTPQQPAMSAEKVSVSVTFLFGEGMVKEMNE